MAEHNLADAIKLASNENPYGPLPSVAKAIEAGERAVNRYPDHRAATLRAVLADRHRVDADRVAVGCGSVGLLQQLALAYAGPGDAVAFGWRSFEAYPIFAQLSGADAVPVPLRRQTIDGAALSAALDERTRLVLVANANNPTGTALRTEELVALADATPDDCLLVVDEAYREFATGADVPDAICVLGDRSNVAVLRTFSKAHGLAGLRVGYMVAAPDVVDAIDKVLIPFSVNAIAQVAALAAVEADDELDARVDAIVTERTRVAREVRARGFACPDTQANFVWLAVGERAAPLALELEKSGVVTRPFPGDGVRVTIGTPGENDRFLAALAEHDDSGPSVAVEWLNRLDAVEGRLSALATAHLDGLTGADPATGEQWDAGQAWAHLSEFGDYWLGQLDVVIDAPGSAPVPFGRVKTDPARIAAIAEGRTLPTAAHVDAVRRAIDRLRARLCELTAADWASIGRHSTLGDMDVATQLKHFHVGHYEEHADQLEELAR